MDLGAAQAQEGAEEDVSDDDSRASDEPLGVQQQLRVANLSAAAQTLSSPQGAPERLVGIGGADQHRFEPPARGMQQQQPEEVYQDAVAPRYAASAMANAQHPEAVVLGEEAR